MAQYKTIAGPIGLEAESGQDYEAAVKKYAAIIDAEAVGGWELQWIQMIPVTKLTNNISAMLALAAVGAIIGAVAGADFRGPNMGAGFMGLMAGGAIGLFACKNKAIEFFNMLVFAKKD